MTPSSRWVDAAAEHADTVLGRARDRWGERPTPLLADGLAVPSYEPVRWVQHGRRWILSNAASQQNFLRTLCGLTAMGRGEGYRAAAEEIVDYTLRNVRLVDLVWWGGHCAVDLDWKLLVHCREGAAHPRHELKGTFPFYDVMFAVDAVETRRVIEGIWQCHVRDWATLTINRHNVRNLPARATPAAPRSPWDHEYAGGRVGEGDLGFLPAGMDLVHAAATLSRHTGDGRPLTWALRLLERYLPAGGSGLPIYQQGPSTRPSARFRNSGRGDRASEQFGASVREHEVWTVGRMREALYCLICLLHLGEEVPEPRFTDAAVTALLAFVRTSFDAERAVFHPVLTDGTRLSGVPLRQDGYFGEGGSALEPGRLDKPALVALAHGYRASRDTTLWAACRVLVASMGLGDLGPAGGTRVRLARITQSDPLVLVALLALHEATGSSALLSGAEEYADRLVRHRLRGGLFVAQRAAYARIDALEPLALLHLARVRDGAAAGVPAWVGGRGRFHALFDGHGRTTDSAMFYDGKPVER